MASSRRDELLQHPPQVVVDPDIAGMALLGPSAAPTRPARASPASLRAVPSKCRLIGAQLVELRRPGQGLQCGLPGRLVGLIQGGRAARCARGRGRRRGRLRSAGRAGRVFALRPGASAAQSSSAAARASATDGGRALIFAPASAGGRAAEIDPGLAEGLGVVGVGDRAVRVVGLGRADVDQAIEQGLVALGRVQPGLDLACAGPADAGPAASIAGGLRLLDGGQGHLPAGDVLGVRAGLVAERVRLAHDPVDAAARSARCRACSARCWR